MTLNNVNLASGETYVIANNAAASEVTEQQTFGNNDSHRTVVLIQNYNPQVINAMDPDTADYLTVQGTSTTDEKPVRYGRPESGYSTCPTKTRLVLIFKVVSGLKASKYHKARSPKGITSL